MGDLAVAAQVDPVGHGLDSFSKVLGIKRAQQELETGQYVQQQQKAAAAVSGQEVAEMRNAIPLFQDPEAAGIIKKGENGEYTPTENAYSIIKRAMPMYGDKHYGEMLQAMTHKLDYKSAYGKLTGEQQGIVSSAITGAITDPDATLVSVDNTRQALKDRFKGTPNESDINRLADLYVEGIKKVQTDNDPAMGGGVKPKDGKLSDKARAVAMSYSRGLLPAEQTTGPQGLLTPQNAPQDLGGHIQPAVQNPAVMGGGVTPVGAPMNRVIPAGMEVGPNGQLVRVATGGGSITPVNGVTPPPAASGPAPKLQPLPRPNINAPRADQEAYQHRIQIANDHVSQVSTAVNDPQNGVQPTRWRNQQILNLIPHADTGPGRDMLNKVASAIPGSSGDAYQDLEHYLAQNSAAIAKAMGVPGTNLGAETAAAASGNVHRNPGALAEITKANDALNTGLDLYNRGLQKIGNDPARVPSYQQAFGQNMDVDALRWADAHRRKDTDEINALKQKLGPKGIQKVQQHLRVLKSLSESGDLP